MLLVCSLLPVHLCQQNAARARIIVIGDAINPNLSALYSYIPLDAAVHTNEIRQFDSHNLVLTHYCISRV